MRTETPALQLAALEQQCRQLPLPAVSQYCGPLAEQATKERQTYLGYLEALLQAEIEERERKAVERRVKEAHLPRWKTLDEFDFSQTVKINAAPHKAPIR
jgi:DNA replication protein DnaC